MKIDPHKIYRLQGKVQHYDWGGFQFIPDLLGIKNNDHVPHAEYWMGAHPSAPSMLVEDGKSISLDKVFRDQPDLLGSATKEKFGQLPYLLKILDVKQMLSIQVHPDLEGAAEGFDLEEEKGIPVNSPQRNYKDRNHKPEVMVALSEFWLLHGFRPAAEIRATLGAIPAFRPLLQVFEDTGLKGLFTHVMELPQQEVNKMLLPVVQKELRRRSYQESEKEEPGYWVGEYYLHRKPDQADRGIFAIYLMNIVHLEPGQVIFQGAGLPHAYLRGQNVELMANSDNVLRAGLTTKHVDVEELVKHTRFESTVPDIIHGEGHGAETIYPLPAKDFALSKIELAPGQTQRFRAASPQILVCLRGELGIENSNAMVLHKGQACICFPGTEYILKAHSDCRVFRAGVPV